LWWSLVCLLAGLVVELLLKAVEYVLAVAGAGFFGCAGGGFWRPARIVFAAAFHRSASCCR
jgi:hypothetical protein